MSDAKKVWIDLNDCGLVTVEAADEKRRQEAERQRREEEIERKRRADAEEREKEKQAREEAMRREEQERAKTQALATQPRQEILPPAPKVAPLALPDLSNLERQIRNAAEMLDLSKPEGWLDSLFGRPDHRLDVKTERGRRLAGYIDACTAILEAARAHQAIRYQIYLDQLAFLRRVAEENCQIELTQRRAGRQDAIEAAQSQDVIDAHGGNSREHGLRGRPLPPPPPPPLPPPVDEATRKREEARQKKQELLDLDLQELDLSADAGQEKVARTKAKAIEIFRNVSLSAGEVRARIQEVLDAYGFDCAILPARVREFMQEQLDKEDSYK